MFSTESTINDFIQFIKKFFVTLYYILFRPIKFVRDIEQNNRAKYISSTVFFVISLFIFGCYSQQIKLTNAFFGSNAPLFIRNTFERIFTFPDLRSIFILFLLGIATYLPLKIISRLLNFSNAYQIHFISLSLYYISTQLILSFIAFVLIVYSLNLQGFTLFRNNDFLILDYFQTFIRNIFYNAPILSLIVALFGLFYQYRKVLLLKFLSIPLLLLFSLSSYISIFQLLYPVLGKENSEEYISVTSIQDEGSTGVININVKKNDSSYKLTAAITIDNRTNENIYFYESKCLVLDDTSKNSNCEFDCNCINRIVFYIAGKYFKDGLLISIKPKEIRALEIESSVDSVVLSKYVGQDSIFNGILDFKQHEPDELEIGETYKVPPISPIRVKFISKQ